MSDGAEIGVLLGATLVAGYLAADGYRRILGRRRERQHLARLAGGGPQDPPGPADGLISRRLTAAGAAGPPEVYVLAAGVLAASVGLVTARLIPSVLPAGFMGMAVTLYLAWTVMNEWAGIRARRFEQRLIDAIDRMTGTLGAGGTFTQALSGAASASDGPVRLEFEEALRRLALGMSVDRAFGRMVERYRGEGVTLFTLTLAARQQTGGDIVPTLAALNGTLRDRWRQQRELRAQLGGARMTAIAGVLLPYALAAVLTWQQPHWLDALTTSPLGRPLIFLAVMLQMVGILWTWHILNRKF